MIKYNFKYTSNNGLPSLIKISTVYYSTTELYEAPSGIKGPVPSTLPNVIEIDEENKNYSLDINVNSSGYWFSPDGNKYQTKNTQTLVELNIEIDGFKVYSADCKSSSSYGSPYIVSNGNDKLFPIGNNIISSDPRNGETISIPLDIKLK